MSIVLERLTKRFGSQRVVDDVSLEVGDGELFVLLGPSGSGKSTVLRLIAGLSRPDAGRVVLRGQDVSALPPQRRGTGFVFQNYSIFRHMTVEENVEFGLKIRRVPRSERLRRRAELLDLVGLTGLGSRRADRLSGGQQQRVAIARALAYEPSVLLLDEPFGALDVKIRQQLRRNLQSIQRRLGVTTILVTHDQEEAFELADRLGMMDRGRLMEVGQAEALYARPRSLFTATFLGAGTVMIGRAEQGRARLGSLSLPIPDDIPHEDDLPVQVLFRPEEVALSAEPPGEGAMVLGRGPIVGRNFAAALRRVRVQLSRVSGARQVSPTVVENGALVDAVLPAQSPLPEGEAWVSLKAWHILEPPAASIVACDLGRGSTRPLAVASELGWRLRASVTVLGVGLDAEEAEDLAPRIRRRQKQAGLAPADLRVRFGDPAEQILREQAESLHELIVIGVRRRLLGRGARRIGGTLLTLMERATVPILFVDGRATDVSRVLVCTCEAQGQATPLRIAGRLARRLGASVSLLHVARRVDSDAAAGEALARGRAILGQVGVACEGRWVRAAGLAEGALAEAQAGKYDLVMVGGAERGAARDAGEDPVLRLVARADRPIMVVPAETAIEAEGNA